MKHILVPTDFSDCAKNALIYGLNIAKKFNSKVIILNAFHVPSAGGTSALMNLTNELRHDSEEELKKLIWSIPEEFSNVEVETISEHNTATNAIPEIIFKRKIDLVIMGTKGASGIKEVFLGSVTSSLINKIKVPFLAIPQGTVYKEPQKMLLSADLTKFEREEPMKFITDLCKAFETKLKVLNVSFETNVDDQKKLAAVAMEMDSMLKGVSHSFEFKESQDIEKTIVERAKDTDIITVISRERGFFKSLFHHSVSKSLAMHVGVPLLIVHE